MPPAASRFAPIGAPPAPESGEACDADQGVDPWVRLGALREQLCALAARRGDERGDELDRVLQQIAEELTRYQAALAVELAGLDGHRYGNLMRQHVLQSCADQRARFEGLVARMHDARARRTERSQVCAAALALRVELDDLAHDASCARRALEAHAAPEPDGQRRDAVARKCVAKARQTSTVVNTPTT